MAILLASITKWIWNKLLILFVIIVVLLAAAWVKSEVTSVRERLAEAGATKRLSERLAEDLAPLEERGAALQRQLADLSQEIGSLEALRAEAARAELRANSHLAQVMAEERFWYTEVTHASYYARLMAARAAFAATKRATAAADAEVRQLAERVGFSPAGRELNRVHSELAQKREDVELLRERAATAREEAANHPIERLRARALAVMPTALAVLGGIIVVPIGIKAFLYYCLAPLISRARPVRLLPAAGSTAHTSPSQVSVPVVLAPEDELIVHSDYLQAAGAGTGKRTRFLFSWRMPLTSLAAGLYLMVSVRSGEGADRQVVVAPKKDLFDKLSEIRLEEGSSMVIYPRSLVALVLKDGREPLITRHWQVFNLHSWITFQFRYLVIHGESRLFIKGCRGVRTDPVLEGKSRMTDQGATLGFSANLAYSGIRCETFVDYLRGKDGLFNDRFAGGSGFHLTEEIPDPRRKRGVFGWSLEGFLDGFFKAFGI